MPRLQGALRRVRVPMLVLASSLAMHAVPAAAAVPGARAERYGVTDSYLRVVDPAVRRQALVALYAGGVRLMRSDLSWGAVEPQAPGADGIHRYDWSRNDQWVTELAQAGLRLYPMVGYSAPWASTIPNTQMSHPRDPAQYATFAAAAVARYGPSGSFWAEHPELPRLPVQSLEVWNEPNAAQFWLEQATAPRDYARLYLTTRDAVRRVAPSLEVVAGGLVANGAEAFIRGMFAAEPTLQGALDGIGYHPYLLSPADAVARIEGVRGILDRLGAGRASIQLTEVGWSLLEMSDAQRGANYAAISRLSSVPALKVTRVMPFAVMSNEGDPAAWDQWFGLLNHDGTPKSTFVRWAAEIAALGARDAPARAVTAATTRAKPSARSRRAAARRARAARRAAAARRARASRIARRSAASR